MSTQHLIEIFSAGCPACDRAVDLVNQVAHNGCQITVLDMHDKTVAQRAQSLGIERVPAVLVDGKPAECCADLAIDAAKIQQALG